LWPTGLLPTKFATNKFAADRFVADRFVADRFVARQVCGWQILWLADFYPCASRFRASAGLMTCLLGVPALGLAWE